MTTAKLVPVHAVALSSGPRVSLGGRFLKSVAIKESKVTGSSKTIKALVGGEAP